MLSRVRLVGFSIKIGIFSKNRHIYYYNENKGDIMPIFSLFKYFSPNIQRVLDKFFSESNSNKYLMLEEIRLRSGRPVILKLANNEKVLEYLVTIEDMIENLSNICENSIYSYQNQICNRVYYYKGWP